MQSGYKKIKGTLAVVTTLTMFFGLLPLPVFAASSSFNKQINYQGKLTDSSGNAVGNGTYHMMFRLYTSATSATTTNIWEEDRSTAAGNRVTVTGGLFSVMLGSSTVLTSLNFNQTLYLGVEIGASSSLPVWDGEMTPRKILGTVPAAFQADQLDGLDSSGYVQTAATNTIATSSSDTILNLNQQGSGNIFTAQSGGNTALIVTGIGRLGVGTSTPYGLVHSATSSRPQLVLSDPSAGSNLKHWFASSTQGALTFGTISDSLSTLTEYFRISSTGNVGIGTTSPYAKLSVVGETVAAYFTGTTTATSTFGGPLAVSGTATSTWTGNGINLSVGCFSINSSCVGGSSLTGSGSANRATFWTSASNLSYDDNFVWDNTNKRLGVGTATPFAVIGAASTNQPQLTLIDSNNPSLSTYYASSTDGSLGVNGLTFGRISFVTTPPTLIPLLHLTVGGRLGIGTTSPINALTIQKTGSFPAAIDFVTSPFTGWIIGQANTGDFQISHGSVIAYPDFVIASTTFNTGIGTTSPYAKLSVVGEIVGAYFTGTTTATSTFAGSLAVTETNATSTFAGGVDISDGCFAIDGACISSGGGITGSGSSGQATFWTGASTVSGDNNFFWDNTNKRLGIGTTSPWARLSVAGVASQGKSPLFSVSSSTLTATSTVFQIDYNGNVGVGTTSPYAALSVVGGSGVVADHYVATSTRATSTFAFDVGVTGRISVRQSGGQEVIVGTPASEAHGLNASSIGADNTASSTLSSAYGYANSTLSNGANAFGYGNLAGGVGGTGASAIGSSNTASGGNSNAFGFQNQATGENSSAFGYVNVASNQLSTVLGANTTNDIANSVMLGSFNVDTSAYGNILLAPLGGKVGIGTTSPYAKLSVVGEIVGAYFTGTTTATSTFAGSLAVTETNATSTFAGGIDLSNGCFAIGGTCVGGGITGSGSSGQATFWTGASTVSGDNSFFWDNTNKRLGIGTTSPWARLSVAGVASQGKSPLFSVSSSTLTATSTVFQIDYNGNVGVGTTSPYAPLSVVGQTVSTYFTATSTTATSTFAGNILVGTTSPSATTNHGVIEIGDHTSYSEILFLGSGATQMYAPNATLSFATGGKDIFFNNGLIPVAMTILGSNSNVGISTTTPYAKLSISANTRPQLLLTDTGGGVDLKNWYASTTAGDFTVGTVNDALSILTERFRITNSGNVGIGTTSPYAKLSVVGEIVGAYFTGTTTATSTFAGSLAVTEVNATSTFAGGVDISDGCFAIDGTCIGGGSGITGLGSSGQATFWTGASTVSGDNNFFWDNTNKRLGLGTTTPLARLQVGAASSTPAVTSGPVAQFWGTNVQDGGAMVTIFSTSSPSQNIGGSISFGGLTTVAADANPFDFGAIAGRKENVTSGNVAGFLQFSTRDTTDMHEKARISSSGNFGIGTTSPYARLSVVGETVSTYFTSTSTTATSTFANALYVASSTPTQNFSFAVGSSSPNLIVDRSSGFVGVGTSSPYAKLSVNGSIYADYIHVGAGNGNTQHIIGYDKLTVISGVSGGSGQEAAFSAANADVGGGGAGGTVDLTAGNGNGGGAGGDAVILAGTSGSGTGGSIVLTAGNSSSGIDGSITFTLNAAEAGRFSGTNSFFGLGTTSPYARLSVVGQTVSANFTATSTTATSTFGGNLSVGTGTPVTYNWFTVGTSSPLFGINRTNGIVAIGTSTDAANNWTLTVQGGVCITAGTTCGAGVPNISGALVVDTAGSLVDNVGDVFDVAELYPASEVMEAGEIASVDTENTETATLRKAVGGDVLVGVVSTAPAISINGSSLVLAPAREATSTKPKIALVGRVPVKVNLENGPIKKGDYISVSSVRGVGRRARGGEQTVGIALEPWDGTNPNDNKVLVFVSLGNSRLSDTIQADSITSSNTNQFWTIDSSGQIVNFAGTALENIASIKSGSGKWSIDEGGVFITEEVRAKKVKTEKLCIGSTCITEAELQALLRNASINAVPEENVLIVAPPGDIISSNGGGETNEISGGSETLPSEDIPASLDTSAETATAPAPTDLSTSAPASDTETPPPPPDPAPAPSSP